MKLCTQLEYCIFLKFFCIAVGKLLACLINYNAVLFFLCVCPSNIFVKSIIRKAQIELCIIEFSFFFFFPGWLHPWGKK